MAIKLTDTQLVMLSAASQREDRCISAPTIAKGAIARKAAEKLVAGGLTKEIRAKPGAFVWRRDETTGQGFALKLTAAGARAIVAEGRAATELVAETVETRVPPYTSAIELSQGGEKASAANSAPGANGECGATFPSAPRGGSKLAIVIGMLRADGGATIAQLATALEWLPHTTRAALTGLRKRGFELERRKQADSRAGAYVITGGCDLARVKPDANEKAAEQGRCGDHWQLGRLGFVALGRSPGAHDDPRI